MSRSSRRSAREPTIEEESADTDEPSSRQESEVQEEEREETPTQVKLEEAAEEHAEVASRDSTPPKREGESNVPMVMFTQPFEAGKRKASEAGMHETRRGRKRIRDDSEPVDIASPGTCSTIIF